MINKSATKACEILWNNGNVTTLYVGANSNTGATIVWQVVRRDGKLGKSMRFTGGNITKLRREMNRYVAAANIPMDSNSGFHEGRYIYTNDAAMATIR